MRYKLIIFLSFLLILSFLGCPKNRAPQAPQLIVPRVMMPNIPDTFRAVSYDEEGHQIQYRFDFGNGIISSWGEFVNSGDTYRMAYTYGQPGDFNVRAQAKDEKGKTSAWSSKFKVSCGLLRILWQLLPDDDFDCEINSTPAISDDGTIYVGCVEGHIHALTPNGNERWRFTTNDEGEVISSVVLAPNGSIYAQDRDGFVYRLRATDGSKQRERYLAEEIVATPAVSNSNKLFINTLGGLFALDEDLNLLWAIDSIYGVSSGAIDNQGYIYLGTESGYFYSLDTLGNIRWRHYLGDEIISSPAIIGGDKIAIPALDGRLWIFNSNGQVLDSLDIGYGEIKSSPVVGADSCIYLTTEEGNLVKLRFLNNALIEEWRLETGGYNSSTPLVLRMPQEVAEVIAFKVSFGKKTKQDDADSLYLVRTNNGEVIASTGLPYLAPSDEGILSSPMITPQGILLIGAGIDDEDSGGLVALTFRGNLSPSVWPCFRGNLKNTGNYRHKK
jgi:outer membrane protein assembly factor BamB